MQNVTFTESVETARAHILNIREMYDIVALHMAFDINPQNCKPAYAALCIDFCNRADFSKFPEWAQIEDIHVCAALEMIVDEWEY